LPLKRSGRSAGGAAASPESLRDWVQHAEKRFRAARLVYGHGTENALDEAAWLLLHALGLPHEALNSNLERRLTPAERRRVCYLIHKRISERIPLAYLLNEAWLGEHRFYVDRRVIVPRSYIAETLRAGMRPWIANRLSVKHALDLCTGSGCLAVLMAETFQSATVDAIDMSADALAVARKNIDTYKLSTRIRLVKSDLFASVDTAQYDLIVSNPPYVGAPVMNSLPPEYRAEPKMALAGGKDGFKLVRRILAQASEHLFPEGLLIMEVGHNRRELERALPQVPFTWIETTGGDDCVFILRRNELQRAN
jgi:ribosomal protein L3 glutamine methyltransferase